SNCFVVHHSNCKNCIVIDPGSENTQLIETAIDNKTVDFIILTHEHFDHIWGVDKIRDKYHTKLYCSDDTNKAIINKKKNLSLFYNQTGFELRPAETILTDGQSIDWHGIEIFIISTPGHTPGSICIKIGANLFTGDTIIKSVHTVTKLPGGNKKDLELSLQKLKAMNLEKLNLYCGHGE
ncbi:MAG: MBL fold metallo-hydrolase, partial [Bacteroidales bacterium]|nr:MBL fold metallo-hydrolase [Bacteroidales bacterium]